jgi:hypothetical protein
LNPEASVVPQRNSPGLPALLPVGWSTPEVFHECVRVGDLDIEAVGMSARHLESGREITASAAAYGTPAPWQRCLFELAERASICEAESKSEDALFVAYDLHGRPAPSLSRSALFPVSPQPEQWTYSKSNGVALHVEQHRAVEAARFEALERRRILSSWAGYATPLFRGGGGAAEVALASEYVLETYEFPPINPTGTDDVIVAGIFGFPKGQGPVVYGFAAAHTWALALARAEGELMQRLAFLWGEDFAGETPEFSPTPLYHQEIFARPSGIPRLRAWLSGLHRARTPLLTPGANPLELEDFTYADITPSSSQQIFKVVKAYLPNEPGLTFGQHPPLARADLPRELWIHPIV